MEIYVTYNINFTMPRNLRTALCPNFLNIPECLCACVRVRPISQGSILLNDRWGGGGGGA